jgi:hypothetical protein
MTMQLPMLRCDSERTHFSQECSHMALATAALRQQLSVTLASPPKNSQPSKQHSHGEYLAMFNHATDGGAPHSSPTTTSSAPSSSSVRPWTSPIPTAVHSGVTTPGTNSVIRRVTQRIKGPHHKC